jgi:hypothetical protein
MDIEAYLSDGIKGIARATVTLFIKLRASELLNTEHIGGCALFERQEEVGAMA